MNKRYTDEIKAKVLKEMIKGHLTLRDLGLKYRVTYGAVFSWSAAMSPQDKKERNDNRFKFLEEERIKKLRKLIG